MNSSRPAPSLRVLFITTWYPSAGSPSAGLFVRDQVNAVARFAEVAVLHCPGADRSLHRAWEIGSEEDPVQNAGHPTWRVRHHPGLGPLHSHRRYLRSVRAAAELIRSGGFEADLIHAHVFKAAVPAVGIARAWGCPVVVTEHATAFPRGTLRAIDRWRARWALSRADRVLPVSAHLQAGIEACGIRARFQVIPNVIDTEQFRPFAESDGPTREGCTSVRASGAARLIFVGGLDASQRKGLPILLRALAESPGIRHELIVVGDGAGRLACENLAGELGLSGTVRFLRTRSRSEVAALLREADLFVLPSREETFGCAVLEALACGVPVITTPTGIHADVVDDRTGRLVPPDDVPALCAAIREVCGRPDRLDHREMRARALAYSPERLAGRLDEVYRSVLQEPRATPLLGRFRRSRFVRQVGATLLTQVLSLAFSLGTATLIARALGPTGKGVITLVTMVPALLALFLSFGLNVSNVYFAGSGRQSLSRLAAGSSAFTLLASALGAVLIVLSAATGLLPRLVPGISTPLLALAQLILPCQLLTMFWGAILQGLERIRAINLANLGRALALFGFTAVFLLLIRWGTAGAVLAAVLSGVLNAVWLGVLLRREGVTLRPEWDRGAMREMLAFGLRGHVGNVMQFFNYRLDVFLLNHYLAAGAVGVYSISVRLAEILWFLPNAVGFVILPRAASRHPEEMRGFTPRVCLLTMLISLLASGVLYACGRQAILLLFGPAFEAAFTPMAALLPGVVLLGGAKVLSNEISGRGFPQYNSWTSGIALVLTIVLCLLWIPRFGVLGAALASSVVYSVSFVFSLIFYRVTVSRRG